MFCTNCGAKCGDSAVFCVMCGNTLGSAKADVADAPTDFAYLPPPTSAYPTGAGYPSAANAKSAYQPDMNSPPSYQPAANAASSYRPDMNADVYSPTDMNTAPYNIPPTPPPPVHMRSDGGGGGKSRSAAIGIVSAAVVVILAFLALWCFTDILPWSYDSYISNRNSGISPPVVTRERDDLDDYENDSEDSLRASQSPDAPTRPPPVNASQSTESTQPEVEESMLSPPVPTPTVMPTFSEVPDLVGETREHLESVFSNLDITPVFIEFESTSPEGTVIFIQDVGQSIEIPATLVVHISLGPPPPPPVPSTLSLRGHTLPPDQNAGSIFGVRGIIESNYIIVSVTVGVYNDIGVAETEKTVFPDDYTYDIRNVDYDILFDILTVGNKTYVVEATDEVGTKVLLSYPFRVQNQQNAEITGQNGNGSRIDTGLGENWAGIYSIRQTVRLDVPSYDQRALGYPLGCEVVAIAMMMNFEHEVSVHDLAQELPRADHPDEGFRGDPASSTRGWTIFPPALSGLMEKYLGGSLDMSGLDMVDLLVKLNENKPVMVWVNGLGWPVHALCLTGYDRGGFFYNDPWTGAKDTHIAFDDFYEIWNNPVYDRVLDLTYTPRKALSY